MKIINVLLKWEPTYSTYSNETLKKQTCTMFDYVSRFDIWPPHKNRKIRSSRSYVIFHLNVKKMFCFWDSVSGKRKYFFQQHRMKKEFMGQEEKWTITNRFSSNQRYCCVYGGIWRESSTSSSFLEPNDLFEQALLPTEGRNWLKSIQN